MNFSIAAPPGPTITAEASHREAGHSRKHLLTAAKTASAQAGRGRPSIKGHVRKKASNSDALFTLGYDGIGP
jgi:hypothetical protein